MTLGFIIHQLAPGSTSIIYEPENLWKNEKSWFKDGSLFKAGK